MVTKFINSALATEENVSYLSTDLNSLADDANFLGASINNSSNRLMRIFVWLTLASVDLSAQTSPGALIRLIQAIGSSSSVFEDDDDAAYGITLPFAATNAAHKRVGELWIPPGYFKFSVVNQTGAAFASSGNVMGHTPFTPETDV